MPTQSYKSRTNDVRKSARAHLAELRKARLAQRDAINGNVAPPAPVEAPAVVDDGPDMLEDIAARSVAGSPVAEDDISEVSAEMAEEDAAPLPEDPAEDSAEVTFTEEDTPEPDDVAGEEVSEHADAQVQDAEPDPAPLPDDWQTSPLAALPGAGPGLVWVLAQCGVETMEDLAAREPVELSEALGVIGQIIDISTWTEFAAEQVAAQG